MKTTLLMAISINGLIAGPNDDTEWVKDLDILNEAITKRGIVILGKRTYDECMKYDAFPYKNALNIVMTHDKSLTSDTENVTFTDASPAEVLKLAQKKGFDEVLLIGGGHINASFLREGLIDEIILDVHSLILTQGIHLFEGEFAKQNLELISHKQMTNGIAQLTYKILKD